MLNIDAALTCKKLLPAVERLFSLSAEKIRSLQKSWQPSDGTPVFTVKGQYTSRGWTEWTQGFQFGSAILQFDATGSREFLEIGRRKTVECMASHVSHIGVHDHGFNNISTYGNLHRLMCEGRIPANEWELNFYELALKLSGAVQAARWTQLSPKLGYVYSFNGPHSLFSDTIRSMRILVVAHQLGHRLMGEQDAQINLLHRALQHAEATARYNVYFGKGRDGYDDRGRVVHESIFNLNNGSYRCPSTQQGYTPFSTWTRGGCVRGLRFLDRELAHRRHPLLGHRRPELASPGRLGKPPFRPLQRLRARGQFGGGHCRAGIDPIRELPAVIETGEGGRPVLSGRPHARQAPVFRALPFHQHPASGIGPAFGVSSAEPLGLRSARPQDSLRRVLHVGRLPCP